MMLEDLGLSLNLLKFFVQHRVTILGQQGWTMLASFEHTLSFVIQLPKSTPQISADHIVKVEASSNEDGLWQTRIVTFQGLH